MYVRTMSIIVVTFGPNDRCVVLCMPWIPWISPATDRQRTYNGVDQIKSAAIRIHRTNAQHRRALGPQAPLPLLPASSVHLNRTHRNVFALVRIMQMEKSLCRSGYRQIESLKRLITFFTICMRPRVAEA